MNRASRIILNTLGVIVVLALGVVGARTLMADRVQADAMPRPDTGVLVRVLSAESAVAYRTLVAAGTVVPAHTLVVQPEVQGRIRSRHPALEVGGHVREGEVLVRLDDRDHRLAVADARVALENARTHVELEAGRAELARLEWEQFGDEEPSPLALREPQRRQAELQVEAARQTLQRAELQVERTTVRASLNAVVREAGAEPGQLVGPQSVLATLVGTDRFDVQISLPADDLRWLTIPGVNAGEGEGGQVRVRQGDLVREGRIHRLMSDVDSAGRMARLLITVEDPLDLDKPEGERQPLLLGAWVDVELPSHASSSVVWLPREALRDGGRVFLADSDDRLRIQTVTFAWREADRVAVAEGVAPGDRVILSRLPSPVEGMRVRLEAPDALSASGPPEALPEASDE